MKVETHYPNSGPTTQRIPVAGASPGARQNLLAQSEQLIRLGVRKGDTVTMMGLFDEEGNAVELSTTVDWKGGASAWKRLMREAASEGLYFDLKLTWI